MSGPQRHHDLNRDDALASALSRLPARRPPQDLWPRLVLRARRRRARRRAWRTALPVGLAAAIALAIVLPLRGVHHASAPALATPSTQPSGRDAAQRLALWQQRSQSLQAWVDRASKTSTPLNGSTLSAMVDLQDRIGLVDLQLDAARGAHAQLPLWRRRVALLRHLAWLRMSDGDIQPAAQHQPGHSHPSHPTRI